MSSLTYTKGGSLRFHWEQILDQREVWVDRAGVEHPLSGMDPDYLENALRWVRDRIAPSLRLKYRVEVWVLGALLDDPVLGPRGGIATDAAWEELDRAGWDALRKWDDWPLVRALQDELERAEVQP